MRIAQNSPKTGTTWSRPASSESRESSYEQDENVPPGFEDFAMHSNVGRRSSHSVVQATGNSNLNGALCMFVSRTWFKCSIF